MGSEPKALQLFRRKYILDLIENRRRTEANESIGLRIEKQIIQDELDELEKMTSEGGPSPGQLSRKPR